MTLAPGTRLGPYEIVAPLGEGGMGEVYRARDGRLERDVAIKSLPSAFARDPERLHRFQREARALASLNHPNIGAIYGLEDVAGATHLVLELVEGETLAARLKRGPMRVGEALNLCAQIAAAIEAAHERGVVHRDLKPGNVMIAATDVVKVLDFGLAKSGGDAAGAEAGNSTSPTVPPHATVAGTILGTAAYMSPEQARGKAVDRRTDVWSFGCVLYECLAGRPAFAGDTLSDLIVSILEREPDWVGLPAGLPPRVLEITRRCLRKDANARPRDIRDVRLELVEVAASSAEGGARADAGRAKSIAVLPFNNLSGSDDEYFADGITEEIMNALAHLEGLRVASRNSCFAFKGKREDPRSIAEKLDVTTVLEGSVRRSGERLRITAQLVNAADGYQLWSERYDRNLTDVFEVQDEIANAIATKLRGTLAGEANRVHGHRGTTNLEAYEQFLKGRVLLYQRGRFVSEAVPCFERALVLDPKYADALALLSDGYRVLATFSVMPASEGMPRARAAAERALAIEPESAEALATLADVEAQYDRDIGRAGASWERALAADPRNIRARSERALFMHCYGVWTAEESAAAGRRVVADDPLNAWAAGILTLLLSFAGRHAQAIAEGERAVSIDPASFFAQAVLLRALCWGGEHVRAFEMAPRLLVTSGRHQWVLGPLTRAYAKAGRPDVARAIRDELDARARMEFIAPFWRATAASWAGLPDEAMLHAERAFVERDPLVVQAGVMYEWEEIRADHRYARLKAMLQVKGHS
jgi:serine/threonine protein kinase/tetratricopeptide (TPR) repeat protein